MSEKPPGVPSYGQSASGFPAASPAPGPYSSPQWPTPAPRPSRWPTFAALAIALLATVLAIVGWFRPTPEPVSAQASGPTYSEQQIADAKARACAALDVVNKGVTQHAGSGASGKQSDDPAMAEAQAADSRLAIIAGGWYLRNHVEAATPPAISAAIQHLSGILLDLGANYLAGVMNADPKQAALISDGNSSFDKALELCK